MPKKALKEKSHDRVIATIIKTFYCKDCGKTVTEQRYPGPQPTVCTPCLSDPERLRRQQREWKRAQRARDRGMSGVVATTPDKHQKAAPEPVTAAPIQPDPPAPPAPEAAAVFLPDYQPAKTRKQVPPHYQVEAHSRKVLCDVAAGLTSSAESQLGIQWRKTARRLAEVGFLAEMSSESNHRNHWWKLTQAGLNLIRENEEMKGAIKFILKNK